VLKLCPCVICHERSDVDTTVNSWSSLFVISTDRRIRIVTFSNIIYEK